MRDVFVMTQLLEIALAVAEERDIPTLDGLLAEHRSRVWLYGEYSRRQGVTGSIVSAPAHDCLVAGPTIPESGTNPPGSQSLSQMTSAGMPVAAGAGEGDPCRWSPAVVILASDLREAHDPARSRVATDANRIPGGKPAFEDGLGQRILDLLLNGALERPGTEHRVETGLGQFGQRAVVDHQPHFELAQPLLR